MRIQSGYAMLDVKSGRRGLERAMERGERVPVLIRGFVEQTGNDDGMSTEFCIDVTGVEVEL